MNDQQLAAVYKRAMDNADSVTRGGPRVIPGTWQMGDLTLTLTHRIYPGHQGDPAVTETTIEADGSHVCVVSGWGEEFCGELANLIRKHGI